eukprot:TRINITY_DN10691_c0_g1_i1.p1 TRINITY_DN10691_c0_g1~~TRINITY_DN10691_c0_g1_i1.p1  ORF type:complete len:403 (+),score=59.57 TRINITY_DN10691_c0_g1_i1:88-1296(+)
MPGILLLLLGVAAAPAPLPPHTRRPQCQGTDAAGARPIPPGVLAFPAPHPLAPWDRGDPGWVTDRMLVLFAFPEGAPVVWRTQGSNVTGVVTGHDFSRRGGPVVLLGQDRVAVGPAQLESPWRRGRPPALTAPPRGDGLGAQMHCAYASMAVAYHYRMPFCHTPIWVIGHGERHTAAWEEFFGLLHPGLRALCPVPRKFLEYRTEPSEALARRGPVPVPGNCGHVVTKPKITTFYSSATLSVFRGLFWYNMKPAVWLGEAISAGRRVSLHVRLGDAVARAPGRVLPFWVIADQIAVLRKHHPGASFHVHSDGRAAKVLKASDVTVYVGEPLALSFVRMVSAEVLVLAISQLSWIAGMLSECSEIWFPQLWLSGQTKLRHPPLPHWRPYGPRQLVNATARPAA